MAKAIRWCLFADEVREVPLDKRGRKAAMAQAMTRRRVRRRFVRRLKAVMRREMASPGAHLIPIIQLDPETEEVARG